MAFLLEWFKLLGWGGSFGFLATLAVMIVAIIALPRVAVPACLVLAVIFGFLLAPNVRRASILAYGVPAEAKILRMEFTGMSIKIGGSRAQSRVRLQVQFPRPNLPPVQTEIVTYVLRYNALEMEPGKTIPIKYDPQNPERAAIIEKDTWGRF
ncbi:MAG: DUF3592 domain-containing protein [Patescibacteria group bacterium]